MHACIEAILYSVHRLSLHLPYDCAKLLGSTCTCIQDVSRFDTCSTCTCKTFTTVHLDQYRTTPILPRYVGVRVYSTAHVQHKPFACTRVHAVNVTIACMQGDTGSVQCALFDMHVFGRCQQGIRPMLAVQGSMYINTRVVS